MVEVREETLLEISGRLSRSHPTVRSPFRTDALKRPQNNAGPASHLYYYINRLVCVRVCVCVCVCVRVSVCVQTLIAPRP